MFFFEKNLARDNFKSQWHDGRSLIQKVETLVNVK